MTEKFYRYLYGIALKVKAEVILCVLCAPVTIFGTNVTPASDSLA
jgi:hypothetical protein